MTTVAIYARLSQAKEGEDPELSAPARQIDDCRARAEREGWTVAAVYVDPDASASTRKRRPEFERLMLNTNPHPLARLRAIAAPSNMPAFSQAFGCKDGDAMVRAAAMRCQIW